VNPELPNDWLDQALKTREAMTAPEAFTETLIRQLAHDRSYLPLAAFWMDQGLPLGLALAILGIGSMIDVARLGLLLDRGLQAPSPVVLTAVALCASAVWLSIAVDETT